MTDSEVLHAYLKCRGIKMSLPYLNTLLITHPDFPTLISFVDTLDGLGIDCYAAELEKNNFNKIDYPFLAVTPERTNIFEIVYTEEQLVKNNRNILQAWNGMVVFVEDGAKIIDADYKESVYKKKRLSRATWGYLVILSLLLLVFIGSRLNIECVLFSSVSFMGLGLSLTIIQHKNGVSNSVYKAICNVPKSINCNLVLSSGLSSIKKVAVGDISLVYFLSVIVYTFLISINSSGNAIILLLTPVFGAFIFTLVLVGYQKLVIKTWCNICLIITAIIWFQAICLIFFYVNNPIGLSAIILLVLATLISSAYFYLKPYLLATDKLKDDEISLLKWKRDPKFFFLLLKQQMKIEYQKNTHTDVFFGDESSQIQLLVVLKPFCTLCATAFNALYKLFDSSAINMGITVRFAVNPQRLDDRRINNGG